MERLPPSRREAFARFEPVTMRWNDTDVFGHVNNAEYYAFFDTAVVRFLLEGETLAITGGDTGMVVAESGCRFHSEVLFTDRVEVGLAVRRIGRSSVRYGFGLFVNGADIAAADGFYVHVFIDRSSKRPAPLSETVQGHLRAILVEDMAIG